MKLIQKLILLAPAAMMLASCGSDINEEQAKQRGAEILAWRTQGEFFGMPNMYTMTASAITTIEGQTKTENYKIIKSNDLDKADAERYIYLYQTSKTAEKEIVGETWFYRDGDKVIRARNTNGEKTYTEFDYATVDFGLNVSTLELFMVDNWEAVAADYVLNAADPAKRPEGMKPSFASENEGHLELKETEYDTKATSDSRAGHMKLSATIDCFYAVKMESTLTVGNDSSVLKYQCDLYKAEVSKPDLKDFTKVD